MLQVAFIRDHKDIVLKGLEKRNFNNAEALVSEIIVVNDSEIMEAMKMIWERLKMVVEPSGAVPLAAVKKASELFHGKKTGVIISGGNVDVAAMLAIYR